MYFLVEAFAPFSVFRLGLSLAVAALTVRLAMRSKLVADGDGIEWHTMMRTRRWPYETVSYFDLALRGGESSSSINRVRGFT